MTNPNEDFIAHNSPLNEAVLKRIRRVNMISLECAKFDHKMELASCKICNPTKTYAELGGQLE